MHKIYNMDSEIKEVYDLKTKNIKKSWFDKLIIMFLIFLKTEEIYFHGELKFDQHFFLV